MSIIGFVGRQHPRGDRPRHVPAKAVRGGRRRGWRSRLALLALLALCWTLAGCAAGNTAETQRETPDTPGVDAAVGSVVLDDVYLQTATTVPAGGSVPLRVALTDDSEQPDRLLAVFEPAATSVELLNPDGPPGTGGIEVPAEGSVDATTGPVRLLLTGLTKPLGPEALVPVSFDFAHAGCVTVEAPAAPPQQ
ncbi:MAG TPA: copper chaperone PCu(A)C [Geodermatophilus sp.]|nr:copper chaperone PCu(A)C [Geodermatophilus sp.]